MRLFGKAAMLWLALFVISGCARKVPEKIEWIFNLEEARKISQQTHKGLIVYFFKDDCKWCKKMEESTYVAENIRKLSWDYVFAKMDAKKDTSLVTQQGVVAYPTAIVLGWKDEELDRVVGYMPADTFEMTIRNYEKGIGTLKDYEEKAKIDSSNVELLFKLGEKYRWHNRPQEALSCFYKVVALDPTNVKKFSDQALFGAAYIYVKKQDYKGALGEFGNLLEKYPTSEYCLDAELMVAYCYAKLENKTTALALYGKFLKEHPGEEDQWIGEQIDKLEGKAK